VNRSNVFRWYSRFRDERELVENDERGGRPKSTRTEINIAAVADLVKNDSRIATRMITESLNIPKTVVLLFLKEDFCCGDFSLLHEHFKQPKPIERFDNDMKFSKVVYIPKIMLPLTCYES
jgi:hypothetical protein